MLPTEARRCAYPADPARGLHYCTLARNERLYPPDFQSTATLSAIGRSNLSPLPAEGIDMFPADITEYVPVDLHGPGVLILGASTNRVARHREGRDPEALLTELWSGVVPEGI